MPDQIPLLACDIIVLYTRQCLDRYQGKIIMDKTATLEDALELVNQLSPVDKIRLIEQIAPQIERALADTSPKPRKSLRGLWRGSNISESDITQMRQEVWGNFPREDI
ncbi:hypothetical protein NIES4071_89020 [Calothrix sp. NIES-4071]|nr:hypothetical protein NIES4071_89020 [Calothrix sp. NIES-4071]BAZ63169.1 hypothetical protein NIES4105_88950 [Calothrix sp. NIES-4105]